MQNKWIRLKELMGVPGFPQTIQGITQKAKQEHWRRRRVEGVKGCVYEYCIDDVPAYATQFLNQTDSSPPLMTKTSQIEPVYLDEEMLTQVIENIEVQLNERKQQLPPIKKAKLITLVYKNSYQQNQIDVAMLSQLLELAI